MWDVEPEAVSAKRAGILLNMSSSTKKRYCGEYGHRTEAIPGRMHQTDSERL